MTQGMETNMIEKISENKMKLLWGLVVILGSIGCLFIGYYGSLVLFPYLFVAPAEGNVYFNVLTPVCMIAMFFFYEGILFLLFFLRERRRNRSFLQELSENVSLEDEEENVDDPGSIGMIETKKEEPVQENEKAEKLELEKNIVPEEEPEPDDDIVFDEKIFLPLYDDYSMDQLKAMMRISKYIDNVDADMLRQMFHKDMSAEEIETYISMFYS